MTRAERKLHKLIERGDMEWKNKMWQKFVRDHIGCDCCQHYHRKKRLCKIGHQDTLERCHGLPCEDITPTVLK